MFKAMKQFMTEKDHGYLVYRGENTRLSPLLSAVNFSDFLSTPTGAE
jgi:hypothetical protein